MRKIINHCILSIFILGIASASLLVMYFTFPYIQKQIETVRAMMLPELQYSKKQLSIGKSVLTVYIADNQAKRELGLSKRDSLPYEFGMLFEFQENKPHGIWMKDMHFPIDIMWIDENNMIIHIEKNISPTSFPHTYHSIESAKYVLEVNAHYTDQNKIKVGDSIIIY